MTRRVALALCSLLLPALLVVVAPPAIAAPTSPQDLVASSTDPAGIPTLSWSRVAEATDYTVQVAATSAFTSTLWSTTTVNINVVPTVQLPSGHLWFRVRANASTGSSDWSTSQFARQRDVGPPLKTPADGAVLDQPSDPVLLSWGPRPGATEYEIEISPSAGFVDPALSKFYKTKTTSLVRPDPQPARPYYWRVRGILATGITTEWSDERSYVLGSLPAATRVSPAEGQQVEDVVLDWNPVPGATSYDVEISLVPDFSTIIHSRPRVLGTRYSPPTTLDNDQYYWRVRARDLLDNPQSAAAVSTWMFKRQWQEQPDLTYPADGSQVGDPFFFEWTPVRLASRYQLTLIPVANAGTVTCSITTTNTTYTPTSLTDCHPRAGGRYTWKVIALDDPGNVQTDPVAAATSTFDYLPGLVTPTSPAYDPTGSPLPDPPQVTTPTVSWEPRAGAASYKVVLTNETTGSTTTATSYTTSWTPGSKLPTGTYRWSVQWVSSDGREGLVPSPQSQWRFELTAAPTPTASFPDAITPPASHGRFPTLQWEPVPNATRYDVQISANDGASWTSLSRSFAYPEGQDAEATGILTPGTYRWRVTAYNVNVILASGTSSQFTIAPRSAVTGRRIAMRGTEVTDPASSCAIGEPAICENVSHTPVLRWDAEPDTGGYLVYLSYDRELTNLVGKSDGFPIKYPIAVNNTVYTPPASLKDSEAGTPYYWTVVPCVAVSPPRGCRTLEYPQNAFSKLSARVKPTTGGVPLGSAGPVPELQDDITLSWEDYLATNTAAPVPGNGLVSRSRTGARQYRVQVSTDPQFSTLLDNLTVDQTTFTSFDNTYPEGQVYWRVQALDGSSNALPWSQTWTFKKKSPVPRLIGPDTVDGTSAPTFDGSAPLRWEALDYASAYDVEIYRNNDTKPDATNLVDKGTIAQTAVSWIDPVAPSSEAYTWRVRRVDAKGRRGDWSTWMSYVVKALTVDLEAPGAGTRVGPRESLFSWVIVEGAEQYRWERRASGAGTVAAAVTTPATAYAPTTKVPDGTWEWRVVALDTDGQELGTSEWRAFTVTGAPQLVAAPSISGTGQVGTVLTSTAPQWSMQGVVNYYQWLRSGAPIVGATSTSYELTATDAGKTITLRVTGRRPGYDDAVATSNAIAATAGPAASTSSPPAISGSGKVGTVLTGTAPTWNEPDVQMTYQWMRGTNTINGATSLDYTVQTADVGQGLSLRVVGKKSGYADATVTSNVIQGVPGTAPVNQTSPTISGTPAVGQTLTAVPGTWDTSGLSFTYQWIRGGAPIQGATSSTYRPVALDAGRQVSVEVRARRTGYADGVAQSNAVQVAKLASATVATLASNPIKRSARGKVTVTVSVAGLAPVGKVQVKRGTKVIASRSITEASAGGVTVRLPRLPAGKHRLKASFTGNDQVLPSSSAKVVLKVR